MYIRGQQKLIVRCFLTLLLATVEDKQDLIEYVEGDLIHLLSPAKEAALKLKKCLGQNERTGVPGKLLSQQLYVLPSLEKPTLDVLVSYEEQDCTETQIFWGWGWGWTWVCEWADCKDGDANDAHASGSVDCCGGSGDCCGSSGCVPRPPPRALPLEN